jgi:hypothetical protein
MLRLMVVVVVVVQVPLVQLEIALLVAQVETV